MAADTTQTRTPAVLRQDRFVQRKQIYCISEEKNRTNLLAYIRMCVCVCMHVCTFLYVLVYAYIYVQYICI